ncbi:zinc finger protein 277-like isoform X2 [Lineus longissimus]|uniref:zinc finger protein 277-like isoform X2 n=1 Tax=Lineus longissimus TaxID=88925 RepID=UPI002B4D948D
MASQNFFPEIDQSILQPLSLPEEASSSSSTYPAKMHSQTKLIKCLFCEEEFDYQKNRNDILKHFLEVHKFVIADVKIIAEFKQYVDYWRERFTQNTITEFCSVINTNTRPEDIGPKEQYYLLCDMLPEDKELRQKLQQEKLADVLAQQQRERASESFSRGCLFCKEEFHTNRVEIFDHMVKKHNFNVGQADNLVYTDEFLDLLEEKLKLLQCLYCEKTFTDRWTLKEHMRKKQHKKVNPQNIVYDKYYIVNYLELGKNWEIIQAEVDGPDECDSEVEDDWSDWKEEAGSHAVCLFCDSQAATSDLLMEHMKVTHNFDLHAIKGRLKLNFYLQVKLVNYIRRQVYQNSCLSCDAKFKSRDELLRHFEDSGHISQLPDVKVWDQPQYYFPTYENDNLLFELSDEETEDDSGPECVVIPECNPVKESILMDPNLRKELIQDSDDFPSMFLIH